MSIGETYKLPDSCRNQDRSGVMVMTLATHPIHTKIGHVKVGFGGGPGLLQGMGVLRWQPEVAWDDVCVYLRNVYASG